jgi:iron(III) transport system permease protein
MRGMLADSYAGMMPRQRNTGIGLRMALLVLCMLLLVPVLVIIASLFQQGDGTWSHLSTTVLPAYIKNSLLLMIGVGLVVLPLGVIPAWLVTMTRFSGSRLLEWALLLPLALPAYIIAYTYTGLLDVAGPVQYWLRDFFGWQYGDYWFPQIRSLGGAVVMLALVLYPYVYLLARSAFLEQSICVLEVSRTLGCNARQAFMRIAIPLARPAIVAGLALVLMETLADYGTVQYFGVPTLTTGIYRAWTGLGSSTAAAQLSASLLGFVLLLLVLEQHSRRQARYHHTSNRYSRLPQRRLRGIKQLLALTCCALPVLAGFIIPVLLLIDWASQTWEQNINAEFFRLAGNSLQLAAITSLLAVLLALFINYGKRLYPDRLTRSCVRLIGTGYAVPGTVIAVGVLIPFAWLDNTLDTWMKDTFSISTGLLFSGTLFVVVFAYLVRFLAVSLQTVEAGLMKIKPTMDEAGRSMGYRPLQRLQHVHMPMLKGSLITAVTLVFVDVLKELPATLILRPFNFNTLAIRTYELANEERLADAASPALLIVLAGIIPVILLSRSLSSSRTGHD